MSKRPYRESVPQEPSSPILSENDLGAALNYYRAVDSYNFQWVLDVCEQFGVSKDDIKARRGLVSKTTMAICRLWALDLLPFSAWHIRLGESLNATAKIAVAAPPAPKEESYRKPSIVDTYIADIDNIVDVIGYAKIPLKLELDLTRLSNADKESLREFYRPKLEEIRAVLRRDDPELVEAYSNTKANLQRIGEFYASIIGTPLHLISSRGSIPSVDESGGLAVKTKRTFKQRKPRAPKFTKLKFSTENTELGLKSIEPIKVHSATTLVTYNAKYDSVTVYHAEQGKTLAFKRTSLNNFDESKSFTKRAGRAKGLLEVLKTGKKAAIIKAFDDVKSKPTAATSLMSEHTILVAAY